MRLTDFTELMNEQFGEQTAASMLVDHVCTDLGGRTGAQAMADGVDPRAVWRALCRDFDVPLNRW